MDYNREASKNIQAKIRVVVSLSPARLLSGGKAGSLCVDGVKVEWFCNRCKLKNSYYPYIQLHSILLKCLAVNGFTNVCT